MIMVAAFSAMLRREFGQSQFVLGTPVAGRNRREFEGMVGLFANMVMLPMRLGSVGSFDRLIEEARRVVLDAFENQGVPLSVLTGALDARGRSSSL